MNGDLPTGAVFAGRDVPYGVPDFSNMVPPGRPAVDIPCKQRDLSYVVIIATSLCAHLLLFLVYSFCVRFLEKPPPYVRPRTFSVISMPPVAQPAEVEPVRRAVAQRSGNTAAPQTPREMAPDLTDANPVPSPDTVVASVSGVRTVAADEEGALPPAATGGEGGDQPVRIDGAAVLDNTSFEPIFKPDPLYPAIARQAGISGYVDADLVVNQNGSVESFAVVKVSGHPAFAIESAKVLPRWRFPQPRIDGKKVKVVYLYRINFRLN